MANISNYLADKILDHILGTTSYTAPTPFLALFTTTPTMPAGTGGTEVSTSGTAYARQAVSGDFGAAASGTATSTSPVAFATATSSYGTVVGYGIYDASTGGNLLFAGNVGTSKAVGSGDTASFASGQLTVTES